MKNIDYKLFITIVLLMIFGVIMISSISVFQSYEVTMKQVMNGEIKETYNYFYLIRSIGHVTLGIIIIGIVTKINYKVFEKYSQIFFGITILLLLLVFVDGIGLKYKGAVGWIRIPGLTTLQPTEFLKVSLILFLAFFFKKYQHNIKDFKKGFLTFLGIIGTIVLIVGAQPDFGTLMILLPITVMIFFYAGANKKHIFGLMGLGLLLFITVYNIGKIEPKDPEQRNKLNYITKRIDAFMQNSKEAIIKGGEENIKYQTKQGLITIGSGGFSGKGFGQSIQKYGYLPEVQGDFIFATIVEELGFRGGLVLILMYLYIGYRGFYISYNVQDKFAKYAAFGITCRFLFQTFINIGVNLNVVPLTGVTLPFISYGGSSIISLSIGVGILLAISRYVEEKPAYARMSNQKFIF